MAYGMEFFRHAGRYYRAPAPALDHVEDVEIWDGKGWRWAMPGDRAAAALERRPIPLYQIPPEIPLDAARYVPEAWRPGRHAVGRRRAY
jgi:hypothetical protein